LRQGKREGDRIFWKRATVAGTEAACCEDGRMNVRVRVHFDQPTEEDRKSMSSLGKSVTNDRKSVRVFDDPAEAGWLVVEFTMETTAQYRALPAIESALRFYADNRMDSTIAFPKSEEEQARADRRAARRRARRRGK
jgi:hypothetical protein